MPALPRLRRGVDPRRRQRPQRDRRRPASAWPREVVSVVDFGDMHRGLLVAEPAVARRLRDHGKARPARRRGPRGRRLPRRPSRSRRTEIALLYPLIGTRLAVSVTNSAHVRRLKPDDPYVTISEAPAWEALERLGGGPPAPRPLHLPGGLRPAARSPAGAGVGGWLARPGGHRGPGPRRGPRHRAQPGLRPGRGQPLPRRRPAGRRDGGPDREGLRRDEEGRGRGGRRPLRRGAGDLPLGALRRRRAAHRRAAHRAPRVSTSSWSRARPSTRPSRESSTPWPTTPRPRTTGPW